MLSKIFYKPKNHVMKRDQAEGTCAASSMRVPQVSCTQQCSCWHMFMCPKCLCVLQIQSKAAEELERFRKASEGGEGAGPRSTPSAPSVTRATPRVLTPTPPLKPQPAMNAPPPPPPPLLLERPSSTSPSPMNPAVAREAMLEAIRSGAAADKLKKVKGAPV